jgi:hypothetical protein
MGEIMVDGKPIAKIGLLLVGHEILHRFGTVIMSPRFIEAAHAAGMELGSAKGTAVSKTNPNSLRQGFTAFCAHRHILYPEGSLFQARTLSLPIR